VRVLVTGAGGQLGRELALALDGHEPVLLGRSALDVTDPAAVRSVLRATSPEVVIHAAAWTDVDACERDPGRASRVHEDGARNVAAAADAFLIIVSTDYVFDGTLGRAYTESDDPHPIQVYGETKWAGERAAHEQTGRLAVVRTAWLYGAARADGGAPRNFVLSVLRRAPEGPVDAVEDQVGSPTAAADLARALVGLAERRAPGVFHAVNAGAVSRYELARAAVKSAGMDPGIVRAIPTSAAPPRPAARPMYAPLEGRAWIDAGFDPLPPWEDALARTLPGMLATL
jgi:dTDP-4-dehydrorhamnose reductase